MDTVASTKDTEGPLRLTEENLTEIVRKCEDDQQIIVEHFDVQIFNKKGDNYTSVLHRITATCRDGNGSQMKRYLIMKSFPASEEVQRMVSASDVFDKEIYAYRNVVPAMSGAPRTPLVIPQFYPTDRADTVILEDMAARGFKMVDRRKRLDLEHGSLALKALARFHGLSLLVLQSEPSIADKFPEAMYSVRTSDMNQQVIPAVYESLASVVGTWAGYERFSEKIRRRIDGRMDQMQEMLVPKKDAFNVLNHGDFWVNNMLFRYNEASHDVEEVCLLDLQLITYGSPAIDLQFFFAASLADGVREEHEDFLLEAYHQTLTDTLRSIGLGSSSVYSLDDLKKDFQEKAPYGFHVCCAILALVVVDPSEMMDFESLIEDNDIVSSMEKTFQGEQFKEAFKNMLSYYETKKVI